MPPTSTLQPLSTLPQLAQQIEAEAADAQAQQHLLDQAAGRPDALDEATLERLVRGCAERRAALGACAGQLARWREEQPAPEQEREIARLEGLLADLRARLDDTLAQAAALAAPLQPDPSDEPAVASRLFQCPSCKVFVALLLFADGRPLEAVPALMPPNLHDLDAPAWVVGASDASGAVEVLKLLPEREPVRRVQKREFNRMIDTLMETHCQRRRRR